MLKMPTSSMPSISSRLFLALVRELFQLFQVRPEDLDRVVALDAGERLRHVVADVLREIPVDAGELLAQLLVHGHGQLFLGAAAGLLPNSSAASRARSTALGQSFIGLSGAKISTR